jgi:hypothetical protein
MFLLFKVSQNDGIILNVYSFFTVLIYTAFLARLSPTNVNLFLHLLSNKSQRAMQNRSSATKQVVQSNDPSLEGISLGQCPRFPPSLRRTRGRKCKVLKDAYDQPAECLPT